MQSDNVIQLGTAAGHERRSSRAGDTPRAWSGRGVVRMQPARPCRRCRAIRLHVWRAAALLIVLGLAVAVYAPVAGLVVHLFGL